MVSEKRIKQIAFVSSIAIHFLVLLVALPTPKLSSNVGSLKEYRIPVRLVLAPPPKQKNPPKEQRMDVAKNPQARAQVVKEKPQPVRLPGDRDEPGFIQSFAVPPVYPKAALNYNWAGKVEIEFLIDAEGNVATFNVVRSSGHDELDQAFGRTVQQYWKFNSRRIMGKDLNGKIKLSYEFKID